MNTKYHADISSNMTKDYTQFQRVRTYYFTQRLVIMLYRLGRIETGISDFNISVWCDRSLLLLKSETNR